MKKVAFICVHNSCRSQIEDRGLEDPTGKDDDAFVETIRLIEQKILELKTRIS